MERLAFVCSCEDTMAPDLAVIRRGCPGVEIRGAEQLCRAQLDRFQAALADARPITVACTQESAVFAQEAEGRAIDFVNIRETAGWGREAASPKMAALLAAAAVPMPGTRLVALKSEGVCLVLGRDATALEAARQLAETLDITVLLTGETEVEPARENPFPVLRGRARAATGWLGAFEVVVDGFAAPAPSSRTALAWGAGRDGAKSACDIILDLSGRPPLFSAHETREGYLRADPADALAVMRAVFAASGLVGSFDKPRFVDFEPSLCAHSRNKRTGCTRCLDVCPTGAITPGKDSVLISAEICAGCGACAAVCPTGAAQYAMPPAQAVAGKLRAALTAFRAAGGEHPVLLLHAGHGDALIDALARHGDGLPARVIPIRINEAAQIDLSILASALAWGAAGLRVLAPGRRGHGLEGVLRNIETLNAIAEGLGLGPRAAMIETDDPFTMAEVLSEALALRATWQPDAGLALGAPREVALRALRALHATTGGATVVVLPALAGFGAAEVATDGCTLCLACTMVCPTGAFRANPDRPELSFLEDACVQCGLCVATCPEKVISLAPRLNFSPEASQPQLVKAEEPAACTRCGKLFGTRSSVDRVKQKLIATGHWMFSSPERLAVLEMCEDCRAVAATTSRMDPYAAAERPNTKTTEDYLREAERAKRQD